MYSLLRSISRTLGLESFIDRIINRVSNRDLFERKLNEIIYQNIFHRFCNLHKINTDFYPLNASANYSLLYLIGRTLKDFPTLSILELGAGQSTTLIDQLDKQNAITIEDKDFWAKEIANKVNHQVIQVPLVKKDIQGFNCKSYDFSSTNISDKFDFIIIDGPVYDLRYSRFSVTELLDNLNNDFILLFDDTERPGEQDTIKYCKNHFKKQGIQVFSHAVKGSSSQTLLFTEKYRKVGYY